MALKHLASVKTSETSYCLERQSPLIPQVPLSNYLEGILSKSSGHETFQWSGGADAISASSQFQNGSSLFASSWGHTASGNAFTSSSIKSEATDLLEAVGKLYESGGISNNEKLQIHAIIDIIQEVSDPHSVSAYGSLDEPGRRYFPKFL